MQPIVCWTEIPVTDLKKAVDFYSEVFGWKMEITPMGPNDAAVFNGVDDAAGGHLYPGTPAENGTGTTVHLTVPDSVDASAERVTQAGGTVIGPVVDIPAGRFQYAIDPDGNSIGLFEPKAA